MSCYMIFLKTYFWRCQVTLPTRLRKGLMVVSTTLTAHLSSIFRRRAAAVSGIPRRADGDGALQGGAKTQTPSLTHICCRLPKQPRVWALRGLALSPSPQPSSRITHIPFASQAPQSQLLTQVSISHHHKLISSHFSTRCNVAVSCHSSKFKSSVSNHLLRSCPVPRFCQEQDWGRKPLWISFPTVQVVAMSPHIVRAQILCSFLCEVWSYFFCPTSRAGM